MFASTKYNTSKGEGNFYTQKETTHSNFNRRQVADMMYKVNGGGRDTYIYNDNGGNCHYNGPQMRGKPGAFFPTVNRSPDAAKRFASINQITKTPTYNNDGTGRDAYVTWGNGGFTNPNKNVAMDPRVTFKAELRNYIPDADYLARRKRKKNRA